MFHPRSHDVPAESAELSVPYPTFEDAMRVFRNCERTALRAFARSEAARIANETIQPTGEIERYGDLLGFFFNIQKLSIVSLRTRRWDHHAALIRAGDLQRQIGLDLIEQGKISREALA